MCGWKEVFIHFYLRSCITRGQFTLSLFSYNLFYHMCIFSALFLLARSPYRQHLSPKRLKPVPKYSLHNATEDTLDGCMNGREASPCCEPKAPCMRMLSWHTCIFPALFHCCRKQWTYNDVRTSSNSTPKPCVSRFSLFGEVFICSPSVLSIFVWLSLTVVDCLTTAADHTPMLWYSCSSV